MEFSEKGEERRVVVEVIRWVFRYGFSNDLLGMVDDRSVIYVFM